MKEQVALVRCQDYDNRLVEEKIREAVGLVGGAGAFFRPGQRVLVKPNLLMSASVDKAVTTHPAVVRAIIRIIQEAGATVVVGDSPSYGNPVKVAERAGIMEVCRETGAEFIPLMEAREEALPQGKIVKRLPLAALALDADAVVSVAKLKTHGLTTYTGAVKNLFGCVVGLNKPQLHLRLSKRPDFGGMLVDLYHAIHPVLSIVDGVVAMEGEGPSQGRPKKVEALLVGANGLAVDTVAAGLIGLRPEQVLYLEAAIKQGVIPSGRDWVEVLGTRPEELAVKDFDLPISAKKPVPGVPGPLVNFLANQLTPRPFVKTDICKACGICKDACPPEAITIRDGRAVIDESQCIRCYCCQEVCPHGAMELRARGLARLWSKK